MLFCPILPFKSNLFKSKLLVFFLSNLFYFTYRLRVQIVMFPQGPQLGLPSHIPDGKFKVLVLQGLHIEPYSSPWSHEFVLFEFEQDRGFTSAVQTKGDYAHLHLGPNVHPVILREETKKKSLL
jgi:hypothetical protein